MSSLLHETALIDELRNDAEGKIFELILGIVKSVAENGGSIDDVVEPIVDAYVENQESIEGDDAGYGLRLLFALSMLKGVDLAALATGSAGERDADLDILQAVELSIQQISRLEDLLFQPV